MLFSAKYLVANNAAKLETTIKQRCGGSPGRSWGCDAFGNRTPIRRCGCGDRLGLYRCVGRAKARMASTKGNVHRGSPPKAGALSVVSLADKTHNAEAILFDFEALGEDLWKRFNGGAEGTRWYYNSLVRIFSNRMPGRLTNRFARVVGALVDRLRFCLVPRQDWHIESL